ncbi:unnamed protein product [Triticum turgidum subsp. durum]|uniref:Heparan-alpha-glucosaminide N-acetyltransferase catalytic domain-containing protein n=1 Tax=Triticum turgidum subsp. durum TaxID=4567 RepID=A0A9R1NVZ8_TRITD|nr:unnamed protein product [Triticum turgidum subsp. durum]
MIIVDDAGSFLPAMNHSPWEGVTIADFVMPFFLFIVGVALALAYKRVPDKLDATRKATLRALKLFCVGLVLQGGFFHGVRSLTFGVDITQIRLMGILQRIAIAYLVTALCQIWLKGDDDVDSGLDLIKRYRYQLLAGLLITITYMVLLYGTYVPDWEYRISGPGSTEKTFTVSSTFTYFFHAKNISSSIIDDSRTTRKKTDESRTDELQNRNLYQVKCGVRGDSGPGCNAVGMIDRKILAISVMAIVTCLIGLQYGHIIVHFQKHRERIMHWLVPSFGMLVLAFAMDFFGMHMNKPLYTVSYTLCTAGAAGLLFAGIYTLVDLYGYRRPTIAMEWMGMHALMIFVLIACNILPIFIHGFYCGEPNNNLLKFIGIRA